MARVENRDPYTRLDSGLQQLCATSTKFPRERTRNIVKLESDK